MANKLVCPKCKSENVIHLGKNDKRWSWGKAIFWGILTGGIGLLAGFIGKKGKYQFLCQDCSKRFELD